jgi:hypothetical protein
MGPIGWLGVFVLVFIAAAAAAGFDFQLAYLRLLFALFDREMAYRVFVFLNTGPSLSLGSVRFNLFDTFALGIALFVMPARITWIPLVLWFAWTLTESNIMFMRWFIDRLWLVDPTIWLNPLPNFLLHAFLGLPYLALLLWLTKSWRLLGLVAGLFAAMILLDLLLLTAASENFTSTHNTLHFTLVWLWHLGFAAVAIGWAVRQRMRAPPSFACPRCDYPLPAIDSGTGASAAPTNCPECGTEIRGTVRT